jgi:hypothetical protein
MSPAALQELVEDLAQQLNAPALIEDDELRMVAYSPHGVLIEDRGRRPGRALAGPRRVPHPGPATARRRGGGEP